MVAAFICAVYFYLDKTSAGMEIAAIDSTKYTDSIYEKDEQHEAIGVPLTAGAVEELSDSVYKTPLGFSIVSYSNKWKGKKLVEIYDELLKNVHGKEITYVSEIDVYPGGSELDSNDTQIAGTQSSKQEYYPVFFDFPSIVPSTFKYSVKPKVSVIELYNMDEYDNASQAARTIAHEYGHHFTDYYFLKDNETALKSEYYNLRKLEDTGHEVVFDNWEDYMANYEWDIHELAAEDYVQLMGSPNAHKTAQYKDIKAISKLKNYQVEHNGNLINLLTQNNIYLPLADQVTGLRDYYYSFIGLKNEYKPLDSIDFRLNKQKLSSKSYKITWKKTSIDKNSLYTLICYNSKGEIFWPVKTIRGNEEPSAIIGEVTVRKDYAEHYTLTTYTDHILDDDRIFRLYLILPDGRMQASEPFYVDF